MNDLTVRGNLPFDASSVAVAAAAKSLAKAVKARTRVEPRDLLKPGEYPFALRIETAGRLIVGEDFTRRQPASIDVWHLVARLMSKLNGPTLEAVLREHMADPMPEDVGDLDIFKQRAVDEVARLRASREIECRGRVSSIADVSVSQLESEASRG